MKKHKFLTIIFVAAMTFTMSLGNVISVFSAEDDTATGLNVEFVDTLDGITDEAIRTVPVAELTHDSNMQLSIPADISVSEEDCMGEFPSDETSGITAYSSANSITQEVSDTIETEGGWKYLLVSLAPGEILQATLAGPNNDNINYDLMLYTCNDGMLDTLVAASTLTTYMNNYNGGMTKSVEDGVSYINTGDTNQQYAVIVSATTGCSSTETFTLTISIDEKGYYDAAEPNDCPFDAVTISTGTKIIDGNLNVSNDQDWFEWDVPSSISGFSLSLSNSNYTAEVYYASGSSMVLVRPDSNGIYGFNSNYCYIRVYNLNSNFASSNYELTIRPYGKTASTIYTTFNGDMGTDKASYPEGTRHRFQNILRPSVLVVDGSGYPVNEQEVKLTWISGSWNDFTGNSQREQYITTDSNGRGNFNLEVPVSLGYHSCLLSGAITFKHYYDIDGIVFQCGNASDQQIVYHYAHSEYISS